MKRILITGITGYIGSCFAKSVLQDVQVFGLVREPIHLQYLDSCKDKIQFCFYDGSYESMKLALQKSQPDVVYHLATYYTGSHEGEVISDLIASNITLGAHLLEAMVENNCKNIIYTTTSMCHYKGKEYCPLNLYAATKKAFSDLLLYYTDAAFLQSLTLVLSDTYGPSDCRSKILNLVRDAIHNNERIELTDGQQQYDVLYIDDVVDALRKASHWVDEFPNKVYQLRSNEIYSLYDTINSLLEVNALQLNAAWGARPSPTREIRKAISIYPNPPEWKPQVALRNGLNQFWSKE